MAQLKPEYAPLKEFKLIAEKLVQKFPDVLDGIKMTEIGAVAIMNKEPKEDASPWEIKTVPYPARLDCPFSYYVVVYNKQWESMDAKHKALLAMDVLCSISREDDGKVVPFDLKDHAVMIRTIGVDYMKRPDVPDILNDKVDWKTE